MTNGYEAPGALVSLADSSDLLWTQVGRHDCNPSRGVIMLMSLLAACSPHAFDYHSAYLRISSDTDDPICQGTLDRLDDRVAVARSASGLGELEGRLDLFLYQEAPKSSCGPEVSGCFNTITLETHTKWSVVDHELVHASTPWFATHFFDEGHAVDLAGRAREFGDSTPDSNIPKGVMALDYKTAGHFLRWFRLTEGTHVLQAVLRDIDWGTSQLYARQRFEEITGRSVSDMESEYYSEAPLIYPALDEFEDWRLLPEVSEGTPFQYDFDFDCSSERVEGHSGNRWIERDVTVAEGATYVITVGRGSTLKIIRRRLDPIWYSEDLEDYSTESVRDEWLGGGRNLRGGPHSVRLEAGPYTLRLERPVSEDDTSSISFLPPE